MKNIKSILFIPLLIFCSCTQLDDINPINSIAANGAVNNLGSAQAAVNGIYDALQNGTLVYDGFLVLAQIYTDEAIFTGTFPTRFEFFSLNVQTSNGTNNAVFSSFYDVINLANNVLDLLPAVEDPTLTTEQLNSFLGEARFIRGLAYFYLVNYYGEIPLVTQPTRDVGDILNVPKSSVEAVYEQIIADLQFAESNLLPNGSGRVNATVATGFLARVYLYLGQWQNALDHATATLGADFDLTTIPYLQDELFYLSFTPSDGNVLNFWYGPAEFGGRNDAQPSPFLLTAYEDGDLRRAVTIDDSFQAASVPFVTKYDDFAAGISGSGTDPIYFMRYAEQLLIAAEAAAELGDFNQAATYYNQVRVRAGLAPNNLTADNFEALLLQERLVEFAFEGPHRLFDLRRRGQIFDILGPRGYQSCHDVWPLPQSEIDRNPNLEQNGCCNC